MLPLLPLLQNRAVPLYTSRGQSGATLLNNEPTADLPVLPYLIDRWQREGVSPAINEAPPAAKRELSMLDRARTIRDRHRLKKKGEPSRVIRLTGAASASSSSSSAKASLNSLNAFAYVYPAIDENGTYRLHLEPVADVEVKIAQALVEGQSAANSSDFDGVQKKPKTDRKRSIFDKLAGRG